MFHNLCSAMWRKARCARPEYRNKYWDRRTARLRSQCSQAFGRSILYRRSYWRGRRPSVRAGVTRFFRCGECGKRPKTARPGRLHRGPAGASTVRSMNLTEERYLPGDEALLDY